MTEIDPQTVPQPAGTQADPSGVPTVETDASEPDTAPAPGSPTDAMSQCQEEAAKWRDQALRYAAELDNFRKRTAREAQETRAYANAELLRSILPVLDNFEMGLEAARAESEKSMIFMGMSMVQRQITDFLREQGVQEVEALGKPFDPNLHDAVSQEINTEIVEGTILRVTRRGYKLKDRLLRAASVIVSAHAPAETAPAA